MVVFAYEEARTIDPIYRERAVLCARLRLHVELPSA